MEAATVESTPVSSPEPSPAAPATSAPIQSSTTSQRPTTADDLGSWMRSHATDQEPAVAAPEASAATAQPTTTDPAGDHPSATQGPIPFTVHKTALENARTKEREAATAEFDRDYGWAKTVPQDTIVKWGEIANEMALNPPQFIEKYFADAVQSPQWGAQMKSWAARTLGARAPQAQAQAPVEPQPDRQIIDEHGQVIGMAFSDGGKAHTEWLRSQMKAEFDQKVQPFVQEREQRVKAEQSAAKEREVNATVDRQVKQIDRILGGRKDLYPQVSALMAKDGTLDIVDAALEIKAQFIEPQLEASATRNALDTIHKKAAGNTAGNSGSATPLKLPPNATQEQLAAFMRANER